jgi:hypothetical protein
VCRNGPDIQKYLRSTHGFGFLTSARSMRVPGTWPACLRANGTRLPVRLMLWLMGVWERSPAGISIANRNAGLLEDFRRALPDFRCRQCGLSLLRTTYEVDAQLGGRRIGSRPEELAETGCACCSICSEPYGAGPPMGDRHPEYFIREVWKMSGKIPHPFLRSEGRSLLAAETHTSQPGHMCCN